MSDYHVLTSNLSDTEITLAFHIPIPDAANSAGVNYREALIESGMNPGAPVSRVPWLTTEQDSINAGALYEHVEMVKVDAALSKLQKRQAIDARYLALALKLPAKIEAALDWWGTNRDIP